ncbi:MAG: hypothetical protein KBT88_00540 [Gammaproteobacteria bacterium]|nr:hypothetical protein [Gammaproteobacteria bacterium]MBQ0838240.1 hypothetical protein [Gammaproteobacteria bacterium]
MKLVPKIIILLTCILAIAMVIYPPMQTLHKYGTYSVGYTFIWEKYTVSAAQLTIQLVVLFIVSAALFFVASNPGETKPKNDKEDEEEK